jgi:hypothetical protein
MSKAISVPISLASFDLAEGEASLVEHGGRTALELADGVLNALAAGVELVDGTIEIDLCVPAQRSFHGLVWRASGRDFESFFVRPHQVGNPDAIQYTPNANGISSWQLYHGPGFWAPITFPIDEWFTIRVEVRGVRADVYVGDVERPALAIGDLKLPVRPGGVGIQVGGPGLRVARFTWTDQAPELRGIPEADAPRHPGVVERWEVSDAFAEAAIQPSAGLDAAFVAERSWTSLEAESTGLANLARVNPLEGDRNTVLARARIDSPAAIVRPLELGFSDRATVFLNGRALFRGDATYRNRDYRFLGSIGWWDTLFLPLRAGRNELIVAVSEDVGGWGVQARFAA